MLNNIDIVKTEYGFKFNYKLDNNDYLIEVHFPNSIASYRIPYLLVLPSQINESSCLCVEANNLEVTSSKELLENGLLTAYNLENKLKEYNAPVLIPILPSIPEKTPYYQQLSQECFFLPQDNPYYRIDITQTVMMGRSHNNEEGIGINELGDEFVSNCYKEAISQLKRR